MEQPAPARTAVGRIARAGAGAGLRAPGNRRAMVAAEICFGALLAIGFTAWARDLKVDPLDRIGQVSGLAALQFRFALIAAVLLAALVATVRGRFVKYRAPVLRLTCAGFAGLASALVSGALVVGLRGTPWPLNGQFGDTGQLASWAVDIMHGKGIQPFYPPVFPYLLAWWSELFTHHSAWLGLQQLQIWTTALYGPVAYCAWRLMVRPPWALAMVLVGAMPLIAPYKPYTNIVLVVLLPVFARFVRGLRRAPQRNTRRNLLGAGLAGIGFGALFLVYSGWYIWAAPGIAITVLAAFPWTAGRRERLASLGYAATGGVTAFLVASPNLIPLLTSAAAGTTDRYAYFDTYIEPTYIAMWKFNLPSGATTLTWPPPGELGGVGVFTLLLLLGLAVALTLGPRLAAVQTAAAFTGGAWVLRMWFAQHMERDQAVQLYPRTTVLILYCLLVLCVLACLLGSQRLFRAGFRANPRRARVATVAALCSLALLGAMIGSSTGNRFLPASPKTQSAGTETWNAQKLRRADGSCSPYWKRHHGACSAPGPVVPNPAPAHKLFRGNLVDLIG